MKSITKTSIFYMLLVVFYLLVSYFIQYVPAKYLNINFVLALGELLILIPAIFYLILTKFKPLKEMRFKKISISNILIIILLTYLCMPFLSLLNYISMFFVDNGVQDLFALIGSRPLWLNLFFIALLPAFCEELVFRGVLYHSYRRRNLLKAMLVSAVLFGLFHMNINQFIYASVMGIFFVLVIEATGSIFASMIMHFIINGTSVVLYHFVTNVLHISQEDLSATMASNIENFEIMQTILSTVMLVGMAVVGLILAALVYYWLCRRNGSLEHIKRMLRKPYRKECTTDDGRILSVPLVIGILGCIGYIVLSEII